MVRKSILQFTILTTLLLLSNVCLSAPQLLLFADKTESELGRPIRIEIYAVSIKEKLSEINLTPLNKHFGVITDYSTADTHDPRWPKQKLQTLNLKLYPRQAGNIIIPKLALGEHQSEEKQLKVSKGEMGLPELFISSSNPYERQQFTVKLTLPSSQLSSQLSISEDEHIKGFESSVLKFKRIKQKNGSYLLQIGWALSALTSGNQKIELPAIEYTISGVSRKKYFLPIQKLNIKQLPSYLPPTIPIGKITLQSQLSNTGLLQTDSIIYWNLKITGNLSNAYQLPPLLRQIKSNNQVKFFPANSKRSSLATMESLISSVTHSIPFKIVKSRFFTLPELRLQYFDPDDGKIKTINHEENSVLVLGFYSRSLIIILLLLLFGWATKLSYKKWNTFKYSRLKYKEAQGILQKQSDIKNIRESIRLVAEAEYWPQNITLMQWEQSWRNKYQSNSDFENLIKQLSISFYGQDVGNNLKELSEKLLNTLITRQKI